MAQFYRDHFPQAALAQQMVLAVVQVQPRQQLVALAMTRVVVVLMGQLPLSALA